MEQYLYQLKLKPRLLDAGNWTDRENRIISEHVRYLEILKSNKTLILAGRTTNDDPSGFGLVIFQADTEEDARRIMQNDPAVMTGIMGAVLYPYRIAMAAWL